MLQAAPDEWTIHEAAHLLRRAGFGGSPVEIKVFHALGRRKAVESLLVPEEAPDAFPLPEWADRRIAAEDMRERAVRARRSGSQAYPLASRASELSAIGALPRCMRAGCPAAPTGNAPRDHPGARYGPSGAGYAEPLSDAGRSSARRRT